MNALDDFLESLDVRETVEPGGDPQRAYDIVCHHLDDKRDAAIRLIEQHLDEFDQLCMAEHKHRVADARTDRQIDLVEMTRSILMPADYPRNYATLRGETRRLP